ncbi:MAG: DUF2178 domain-containing protein [Candidatus Longimicrobiales bacterium M2_2A_002]
MTGEMSQTRLRAWWAAGVWAAAGVAFAVAFFGWGGPSEYGSDPGRILAGAVAIAVGYGGYLLAMWATRSRGSAVATDERDAQVVARASRGTLIVVLMAVFGASVGLWEAYRGPGVVPVGWLWFLTYGTVIVTFVVHAVATLVVDARYGGHG